MALESSLRIALRVSIDLSTDVIDSASVWKRAAKGDCKLLLTRRRIEDRPSHVR
jgi:hypothetical protein